MPSPNHEFYSSPALEKLLFNEEGCAFVGFTANDQKKKSHGCTGAFTSFKKNLKFNISEVRKRRSSRLLTSMHCRNLIVQGKINHTSKDTPEAKQQKRKAQL